MGESFGRYTLGQDEDVLALISSANVACGYHAGDPHVMRRTVELAAARGVRVGAHPGLPDLLGFGRRIMAVSPAELYDYFLYQLGALHAFARAAGTTLQHVKPHGALFGMALSDPSLARAMAQAAHDFDPTLLWLNPTGPLAQVGRDTGLIPAQDFYADRAYNADRSLVSRSKPGSVIKDHAHIRGRVLQLLETGTVTTLDGQRIGLPCDSICVHGDTDGALEIIRLVRGVCDQHGIAIRPLAEIVEK
jgi:UPF0271 protein